MDFIREVKRNRGYRAQLIRILGFAVAVFLIIPGFFNLFLSYHGIQPLFTVNGSLFQVFGAFAILLLLAKIRKRIKEEDYYSVRSAERLTFSLLTYLTFTAYLFFRFIVPVDPSAVGVRIIVSYFLYLLGVVLLAVTIMGAKFFKENYHDIFVAIDVTILFGLLSWVFQRLWPWFSEGVLRSTHFLLNLFFGGASIQEPIGLTFKNFSVDIGSPCSGIMSLGMFIALFCLFAAYEWPRLKKRNAAIFFVVGAVGMYAVNILRIFTLMLIGAYWSPSFAIDAFHENIGWVSFIIYFMVLIPLAYRWVVRK